MKKLLSTIAVFTMFLVLCNNIFGQICTNGFFCVKPYSGDYTHSAGSFKVYAIPMGGVTLDNNYYELPPYAAYDQIEFCGNAKGTGSIEFYGGANSSYAYLGRIIIIYDDEAPTTPELNVVNVGTNDFTIDAISSDLHLYYYYFTITGGGLNESGSSLTGSLTKIGLKEGTTYTVTAKAVDMVGNESEESSISITTPRSIETPSGRKSSGSYETASLIWNTQLDATKYYIYAPNGSLLATFSAPNPQAWVNTLNYTVRNLEPGKSYSGYYIVSENIMGMKSAGGYFPAFTTKKFEITGPEHLCTKASYAINNYNSSLFSINASWSTSTVKATNGNGYSIELQKVTDGNGWISFTLKSKSTQKEYTIKKSFVVGTPNPGFNIPTNVYTGERNVISVKNKNYSTYDWNINMSRIVSGQGTSQITFIVDAQTPAPRDYVTMANDEVTNDNTNNYRSTIVRAVKPLPTTNKVKGKLTVSNTCGSATYDFNITFSTKWLARALPDSLDVQLFSEDIPLAIESESASYDESFVIYPNPASSVINIRQPYDKESIKTIDIFDTTGKKCISEVFGNNDSFTTVDISALPKGTYILIVNQNGNAQAGTFIKQ